jgi:hypothetical protein
VFAPTGAHVAAPVEPPTEQCVDFAEFVLELGLTPACTLVAVDDWVLVELELVTAAFFTWPGAAACAEAEADVCELVEADVCVLVEPETTAVVCAFFTWPGAAACADADVCVPVEPETTAVVCAFFTWPGAAACADADSPAAADALV